MPAVASGARFGGTICLSQYPDYLLLAESASFHLVLLLYAVLQFSHVPFWGPCHVEVAGQHDLVVAEVDRWRGDLITQASDAFRSHPPNHAAQFGGAQSATSGQSQQTALCRWHLKSALYSWPSTCRTGSYNRHCK